MCSASMGAEGSVTLQLREAVQAPDSGSSLDGALTIGYPDPEMLADMLGSIQAAGMREYKLLNNFYKYLSIITFIILSRAHEQHMAFAQVLVK